MTAGELVARFRVLMDDAASPYLWTDTEAYAYLDLAQRQFVKRTDLLLDSVTMPVVANTPEVTLDSRFYHIRAARLMDRRIDLKLESLTMALDQATPDGLGQTGIPVYLLLDVINGKGRLAPYLPADGAGDTLTLWGYRAPTAAVTGAASPLEVTDPLDQELLISLMRIQAYDKQDTEGFDLGLANTLRQTTLLELSRRQGELARLRRRPAPIRYGGL